MKKLFIIIYVCVVAILKSYSQTNTISPASQEICSGASPSTLYGTISGSYNTIRWQQSLTGLNEGSDPRNTNPIDFTPAEGVNNSESYMPPALTQKTYYNRYIDFSGCTNCRAEWSTIVVVTVIPPLLDGHLPSGSTLICSNVPTSSYSTSIIDNATSYVWTISPASAGTISGTNTTANVTWNSSYSGIATIKVQGKNRCFSGNFSEELQVSVHPYPAVPDSPTGTMSLCQYSQNTSYSISSTGAASYNWLLSPSNAGTVSSLGIISTVTWNGSFSGQVTIQAQSVGACNTSNYSSPLTIQVNPIPGQASNPEGLTSICQGSQPNNYSTSGANNATSYLWSVSPASAGTISGTGTTGTVAWSTTFTGLATISVKGVNSCGSGVVSNNLTVMVNPLPSKAGKPTGESAVCQGVSNSSFTTSGATNATSYIWNISPTYAGFITGTGISGGVSWNTSFFGVATINVTGVNSCGNGTVSENLNVTVNPLPSKAATPTGENTICQGTANSMFSTAGSSNATSY